MKIYIIIILTISSQIFFGQKTFKVLDKSSNKIASNIGVLAEYNDNTKKPYLSDKEGNINVENIENVKVLSSISNFLNLEIDTQQNIIYVVQKILATKSAEIIANKKAIKSEAGKTTLETSKLAIQSGNLKDLLTQIPGIVVDNNGNVSYKGKEGFKIYVDGKVSQYANSDIKNYIENTLANDIKNIEIITNPDAKFDAEGKSGIINIKTQKSTKAGMNATINSGIGYETNKYEAGISTNLKKDFFNIFANYQYLKKQRWFSYQENRISTLNNKNEYFDYFAKWKSDNKTQSIKTGIDISIDTTSTIGYLYSYNHTDGIGSTLDKNYANILDENKNIISNSDFFNGGPGKNFTQLHQLDYSKMFSKKFSIDASAVYTAFNDYSKNTLENIYYKQSIIDSPNYYFYKSDFSNIINNYLIKLDAKYIKNKSTFESGLKSEFNNTKSNNIAYTKPYLGEETIFENATNNFLYKENIYAGYLNYKYDLGFSNFTIGTRAELTDISSSNSAIDKSYLNLFPNIGFFTYLDSFTNISAKYSKRIDRPTFNMLNNKVVYYNKYTANIGVPTLTPEFADIFSLQLEKYFLNYNLIFTLGAEYTHEVDDITDVSFIDSNFVSYFTFANSGNNKSLDVSLNTYYKINSKLDINLTPIYIYTNFSNSKYGIQGKSVEGSSLMLSSNINYILPYNFKLNINTFMANKLYNSQGNTLPIFYANMSVQKTFLNEKLKLTFSLSDIFNSNIWKINQLTQNLNNYGVWKPETRIAMLKATYVLGKKFKTKQKNIIENSRLNQGGDRR